MSDIIEVSYTGDLLAHRRCPRAWAYEKYAGFHPYEQVQAMEGRLVHHAMEWLTKFRKDTGRHADRAELKAQLEHFSRVLWARGVRTAFASKEKTIQRVLDNLFPPPKGEDEGRDMHPTVMAAIGRGRDPDGTAPQARRGGQSGANGERRSSRSAIPNGDTMTFKNAERV